MSASAVILDVDTGTDDALALAYAVQSPRIELVAATTVAGNVGVEQATRNTLTVLDWLGATDVPVHRGASRPLVRPHLDAASYHHEGGLGGATLPASNRAQGGDRGPAAIIRLATARPGEITLIALGPLTNVAIALNVEPQLPELLKGLVLMGGAFRVPGNTMPDGSYMEPGGAAPAAEFNIIVDPEAAEQVFAAPFRRLTAVGLDVTNQVALTSDDWRMVNARDVVEPGAVLLREIGRHAFGTLERERFALHDPLATLIALDPGLITGEMGTVVVDTSGATVGRTSINGPGSVEIAVVVDRDAALHEFRTTMGLATGP